jgi:bacterioferritin
MQNKEKFISKLNEALKYEYTDFFSYRRESVLFKEKIVDGEKLEKEFLLLSNIELQHADILSNKIVELGGEPLWKIEDIYISTSLKETLLHHIETESMMYKFYSELLEVVTDRNFSIIIQGIRENEKEHLEKVRDLFSKIRK